MSKIRLNQILKSSTFSSTTENTQSKDYEEIFKLRGSRYDQAMRQHPKARHEEFEQIISRANLNATECIADVPAGGGYLKAYLPDDYQWLGHEPCSSFTSHGNISPIENQLLPLPWDDASIDVALSLAGVHHMDDKRPLFLEINRVVKPDGRFVLSDVAKDSPVAYFLDNYVGNYNSTGHNGIFLDEVTLDELTETNWIIKTNEQVNFYWKFVDLEEMETFCNCLFDITKAKKGQTIKAIEDILSVTELSRGIGMNWSLNTIVAEKKM